VDALVKKSALNTGFRPVSDPLWNAFHNFVHLLSESMEAQHAYDLDPWHPLIHLALAGFEKEPIRRGLSAAVFPRSAAERSETSANALPSSCASREKRIWREKWKVGEHKRAKLFPK
jgi:hypothetical protein